MEDAQSCRISSRAIERLPDHGPISDDRASSAGEEGVCTTIQAIAHFKS
jgi:hypothetical protein